MRRGLPVTDPFTLAIGRSRRPRTFPDFLTEQVGLTNVIVLHQTDLGEG